MSQNKPSCRAAQLYHGECRLVPRISEADESKVDLGHDGQLLVDRLSGQHQLFCGHSPRTSNLCTLLTNTSTSLLPN